MNRDNATNPNHETKRIARLFRNGRNQAVRLPREYELQADRVVIERDGNALRLTPVPRTWASYFAQAHRMSEDVPDNLRDKPPEDRDSF